jgi:hypothetical protein
MDDNTPPQHPDQEVDNESVHIDQEPGRLFQPNDQPRAAEDGAPPATPAQDIPRSTPLDHPSTDTGIEPDELYHEGLDEATGQPHQ